MIQEINKQISVINDALNWIRRYKPEHYKQRFIQLVEERRKLRKIAHAESDNPGIAAFGKSQVGKSYLMSSILQNKRERFKVKANGTEYEFIGKINPIGDNTEATGVVTRFSSFKRDGALYSSQFPVLMKSLSVADIIIILSDGYFNDLGDYTSDSEKNIEARGEAIYNEYKDKPDINNSPLPADDVLTIKNYFKQHINNAQAFNRTSFFDNVAAVAERIPSSEWCNVFSVLWNQNPDISNLFNKTIEVLRRLSFSHNVYLPIEAVLHNGIKPNTIMSVDCLRTMFDEHSPYTTDAYIRQGEDFKLAGHFGKGEICALCREVVFKIEDAFLKSTNSYDFDDIAPEVQRKLNDGDIEMAILKDNDLLDFPGARAREQEKSDKLSEVKVLLNMFLRGKVAYLFNKYNEAAAINVLLFCHHQMDNDVTNLYLLLDEWVRNYVGETPEKRRATIESTEGVAPLFYIATKFNMDLAMRTDPEANQANSIDNRWKDRFEKVLYGGCFHPDTVDWVFNWTAPGTKFKNSYLLRDFKWSGPMGSKLYKGYDPDNDSSTELPRMAPDKADGTNSEGYITDNYYQLMRRSFCSHPASEMLFEDRALAWDVAASRNNDGALYIIEKLSVVARNLEQTREKQFEQQLGDVKRKVLNVLNEYHVSEDIDERLMENIRKANSIIREMDFTSNEDNYFFGHLLQALQITETRCLQEVHQLIQSGELGEKTINFSDYEIILKRCRDFSGCTTNDECWQRLQMVYGLRSKEEAEQYLIRREVDHNMLFSKSFKKKINSVVIADHVYDLWCRNIKSVEFMNRILANQRFDSVVMSTLLEGITDASKYLRLNDIMAAAIAEYVNVISVFTINESLVADILSSTINRFIIDLGYEYLSAKDLENVRKAVEQYQLLVFDYIGKEHKSHFDEEELTALFDELTDNPKAMTASFEDNYYTWLEYMYVSFIAHFDVPDYDKEANHQLTEIINNIS